MTLEQNPIDAVITWVDGADPVHKAKLDNYLASIGGERPRAASPARFHNSNEIEFCIVSLLKFAPWIGTVFIVTDGQTPQLIEKLKGSAYESRVKVVDHSVIFADYEDCLPTFNSSTILSVLWRIPGLADQFLFLNDDFALLRPVSPDDFFRSGKVVLRGQWRKFSEDHYIKRLLKGINRVFFKELPVNKARVGYLAAQEVSAKILGFSGRYFQVPHNPHAWHVSTFEKYFSKSHEVLRRNIGFKLRSPEQFIGEALSAHLEITNENYVVDDTLKTLQLKPGDQSLIRLKLKLFHADRDSNVTFVCVQNLEQATIKAQSLVIKWLCNRIGTIEQFLKKEK
ncbi:Stealth CR1 domain-containing protein [Cellvibrio sp. OA-2007]|uniref:Stealth CR1 domain-containing protein n=1 Tax=Cellvibrio sp. OA-2007 TaxID=529823 RepID=UPI00078221B8|nr:Stealth CR1 domain-containing protein [Cellvibrio sp. OA-2007]